MKQSENLEAVAAVAREFVARRLEPIAAAIDEKEEFPVDVFKELGSVGLLGTPSLCRAMKYRQNCRV